MFFNRQLCCLSVNVCISYLCESSHIFSALQVSVLKLWLSFSSIVLAFTFVFGNSIRGMFEAVIFLFIIHPYDVGDSLVVGGEDYRVRQFEHFAGSLQARRLGDMEKCILTISWKIRLHFVPLICTGLAAKASCFSHIEETPLDTECTKNQDEISPRFGKLLCVTLLN